MLAGMDENYPAICRAFQCWNAPTVVDAGKFAHLSARAKWVDGRTIVVATEVEDATIIELPGVRCQVHLDGEWITVIVPGPCEIPARANIVVKIRADLASVPWLVEMKQRGKTITEELL